MARWSEVEQAAPELAAAARGFLDAGVHKTLATLRHDGSPRISGSEAQFRDGDLWFGSMWQALKARDLQRDPRFALHSASVDPPDWRGDAKLSGRVRRSPTRSCWPGSPTARHRAPRTCSAPTSPSSAWCGWPRARSRW